MSRKTINVVCIRDKGDKEAPEIQDPLINSEYIAVKRGTNFLNDNWFTRVKRSIGAPFKSGIYITRKVDLTEQMLDIYDTHIITGINININNTGVWTALSVEQHIAGK